MDTLSRNILEENVAGQRRAKIFYPYSGGAKNSKPKQPFFRVIQAGVNFHSVSPEVEISGAGNLYFLLRLTHKQTLLRINLI